MTLIRSHFCSKFFPIFFSMYIDQGFLVKQTTDVINMCIKCTSKCEVLLGGKHCDQTYNQRIFPDKIFVAKSVIHFADPNIAEKLVYQRYNDSFFLSDLLQEDVYLNETHIFWLLLSLFGALLYIGYKPKNETPHKNKLKKKRRKENKESIDNPTTWGLYSEQYSEC